MGDNAIMKRSARPIPNGNRMSVAPPTTLLSRLRFTHLRLLDVLGRTGNLHRAADELHVTQPAATKILRQVEDILGTALFERSARPMVPTEIGATVVAYARRALSDGERFAIGLDNLKRGGYGALSVGAIMATAYDLLPRAIAELKRRRPLMTIQVQAATSDKLMTALERRELELVIGRLVGAYQRAEFDFEPLANEELWAFAADTHPLANHTAIEIRELERMAWVLQPAPSPMRHLIDVAFAKVGMASPDNVVETTSIFATLQLVRHAGMIAVLPSTIVADEVQRGGFVRLALRLDNELEPYGIITPKGDLLGSNAAEFVSIIREFVKSPS
jgi:DNA-binding transcriptional LysR family regulator